jgi:hypothetical protein
MVLNYQLLLITHFHSRKDGMEQQVDLQARQLQLIPAGPGEVFDMQA